MNDTVKTKKIGDILNPKFEELSDDFFECPKHGTYHGSPIKFSWGFGSGCIKHPPECPKCMEERKAQEAEEESRRNKERELNRLKNMNIGRRYWNTVFDNFSAYTDELKHHLNVSKNFANSPDGKLVMLGENGTGKTHLAISILKNTGGVIYTAFEIGLMLRQSYSGDSREWEILKDLCEAKLLVIDEIGRSKGQEWELNWMSHIINKRHENMRPLILISNRHLRENCSQGKDGCDKCLEKFVDNDVISRIIEDGIVLRFTGTDYRKNIGEEYRNQKKNQTLIQKEGRDGEE
jgi:DNA replication protein DnaC